MTRSNTEAAARDSLAPLDFMGATLAVVILVAAALFAGCASNPTTNVTASPAASSSSASPAATANTQTKIYHNAAFGFSVTYDRTTLMAVASRAIPRFKYAWPGLGVIDSAFQPVVIIAKGPVSQPGVTINPLRPRHIVAAPILSQFTQRLRSGLPANVHLLESPREQALDGLPAIRYSVRNETTTSVQYTIFHGRFIYVIALTAPRKLWPSLASELNAVAQTFTVTN